MSQQLDVYREWLGITDKDRPLNHYQLLRLPQFEDDRVRIRSNYHKMSRHVRADYCSGEHSRRAHQLLAELTRAILCLTDLRRKSEYDAGLGRKRPGELRKHSLEELLLGRKVIEPEQLEKARKFSKTVGIDIRDAIIQQRLAPSELVMQAVADSLEVPYVDLSDVEVDVSLLPTVPAVMARQHGFVPLLVDDGQVMVASPNPLPPEIEEQLRLRFSMRVRVVLCTPSAINDLIAEHYPRSAAAAQLSAAVDTSPTEAERPQAKRQPEPKKRLSPAERLKKKQQFALVGFAVTFMLVMAFVSIMGWTAASKSAYMTCALAAAIAGGISAAIGWFVAD